MRGRFTTSAVLLALLLGVAIPVGAQPLRPAARVVATTRTTAYLDAGRDQGLTEGLRWTAPLGGAPVTITVVAVTATTSVVSLEGATGPFAIGGELALPPGRSPPRPGPGPRPAPATAPPWIPALAEGGLRRVPHEPTAESASERARRARGLSVRGDITARAAVGADLEGQSRSSEDVGLSSVLAADWGGWSWDHALDLHVMARPELLQAPLQHASARFDVYLARLGWRSQSGRLGVDLGRSSAAPGTDAGLVDGGRVRFAANDLVEVGAWAGVRPDTLDLSPELRAPSAGIVGRFGSRGAGRLSARADLAVGADAWRGALDRAFATAHLGVDLPVSVSIETDLVVDAADAATGRSGPRLSRATAWARASAWHGILAVSASGGLDDPFVSQSLVDRLSVLGGDDPVVPIEGRHVWGSCAADVRVLERLTIDAGVRADDGDDGYRSLAGDLGARLFDLGPLGSSAWVRAQVLTGTVLEGVGGEVGWQAPLGTIVDIDLSYAVDLWRVGPAQDPTWAHRGRLALQRRLGERFRTSLSLEVATGAGPPRGYGLLLVGYRL